MNHALPYLRTPALLLAAGLLLAACGGGGGGSATDATALLPGTEVPGSATASASGATDFVTSVVNANSETAEPLVLGDAALATSETDEPRPL